MGLAKAFASGELLMEQNKQQQDTEDRSAAQKWANSMTVSELSKAVKDGRMMPSQSPVFAATVQHIWGDNTRQAEERDLLGRVQTGELKFNSPEEIDQYLTESRNTALAGQSKYAAAGFDKNYGGLRTKLMDAVAKQANGEQVEYAANQATESMMNGLTAVTSPDFKGDAAEGAKVLLQRYELMHKTSVLPEGESRKVLSEMVIAMAGQGNTALLENFLNQDIEGVGKVRTLLGEAKANTYTAQSTAAFDQVQRQRLDEESLPFYQAADRGELDVDKLMAWGQSDANKKYTTSAFLHGLAQRNASALASLERERQAAITLQHSRASIAEAQQQTEAALSAGEFWRVSGQNKPQIINERGEVKDFDTKGYAVEALAKATKQLPIDQQVSSWALNGITNPDWQNRLRSGFFNLSTVAVDAQGKAVGEINTEGQAAIALFRQLNDVNPEYAKQIAGEGPFKRYSDIVFLQHMGKDVHTATAIAAAAASGATSGSDVGNMTKKIRAKVYALFDDPWHRPNFLVRMFGENTTHNTMQVSGTLRRYSELLAYGGQYGDAETAVNKAADYLADPKVSVQVNGTLYMRSELPQAPAKSASQEEWLKRFLDAGPKKVAKGYGFAPETVRLEFDSSVHGYRAMMGDLPMAGPHGGMLVYSKEDIQKWYSLEYQKDVRAALVKAQDVQAGKRREAYQQRINKELRELQDKDTYALERYDTSMNHTFFNHFIYGEEAFRRIEKDGHADKPLVDLMQLYPSKRTK